MDELVLYITQGDPADKQAKESLAAVLSIQKSHHYTTFRNAECPINGAALTGFGQGERLFVAAKDRALVTCYLWGHEGVEQRFAVPEQLTCLAVCPLPGTGNSEVKPAYRTPWLLAGGSKSGRLYLWELALGDLVCVKDAHYQEVSVMAFSECGTFLATGGADTRVNVWRTQDLVAGEGRAVSFADHLLAVTCVHIGGTGADVRVFSSSLDGTIRIHEVIGRRLLTTFVVGAAVTCFVGDPAERALYAGLGDGRVRQIPLYAVNPHSHVLEAVGGNGKIVTLADDVDMAETFVHHQKSECKVTAMALSMDGMYLISGDSTGRTFVADVVTKQVVKAYTQCKLGIACVQVGVCDRQMLVTGEAEKKHRLLPSLKRVLRSADILDHSVVVQLSEEPKNAEDFSVWLQKKAAQEITLRTLRASSGREALLQQQVDKLSEAYANLKEDYDELLQRQ